MAKKRKLNSKSPKYQTTASKKDEKIVKKRVLLCKANPRKLKTGEKVLTTEIPVYGVWYE